MIPIFSGRHRSAAMGRTRLRVVKERFAELPRPDFSCPALQCAIAWPAPQLAANATIPLSNPIRIFPRAWMAFPLCALGFFVLTSAIRARRIEYVSEVAGRPAGEARGAAWRPRLIVPGHHNESFEWLDQTRQMFARGEWRVRHVDYENFPLGREVYAASPYRWWLGLVAWCHREVSGGPIDRSVEWAALIADPLLLLLLGAGTTIFVARRFGILPAALLSAGMVALYPFSTEFFPGAPDDYGLAQGCAVWSVIALLVGTGVFGSDGQDTGRRGRWFFAAGVAGGIGLWIRVSNQAPILAGIALGALIAAWVARAEARANPAAAREPLPWRAWALGGSVTCLGAYLIEFFPAHMGSWELRALHPLFGLAWLGAGELLARLTSWIQEGRLWRGLRDAAIALLAVAAVASVPVAMRLTHSWGFLAADLPSMRLSMVPGGVSAPNLWVWLLHDGITPTVWATVLPVLLVIPAAWLLVCRKFGPGQRVAVALSLGPVLVMLGFSCWQINGWNGLDASLFALIVATSEAMGGAPRRRLVCWVSGVFAAVVLLPGAVQLWPYLGLKPDGELTKAALVGLLERDLAYWLTKHVGSQEVVILAPPDATTALYYYAGIRGLATFGWENRDGLTSAIRIASASTPEEAQELIGRRGVTHIIIPLWDPYMDTYALLGEGKIEGTFLGRLNQWILPPWLRPVPYLIPTIAGFERESVIVLEVVDEQDDATATSRLAEYFVDLGQLEIAARTAQELRRFPAELEALLARAQVAIAEGDPDEFGRAVEVLLRRTSGGSERALRWDQRGDRKSVVEGK